VLHDNRDVLFARLSLRKEMAVVWSFGVSSDPRECWADDVALSEYSRAGETPA
jgi:hypothetical protein